MAHSSPIFVLEYIADTQFKKKEFDRSLAKEKAEAEKQLRQYAQDPRIQQVATQVTLKKIDADLQGLGVGSRSGSVARV